MGANEGYTAGVKSLRPHGTNSTMFTDCCGTAICDDEAKCPRCGRNVIGYDAESQHERGQIRWRSATSHWDRDKLYGRKPPISKMESGQR